ncbi:hypothetical protein CXF68_09140 [Tenacibaculum sp. Bg11-29]|uniref:hypothetical protein n=1 Tax=Tenacibaculum sp. Bg11-29 TaxID=2058306 RepID=UPI000C337B98|nr:hypothetical protein [Tenacibaculum sp. Bg11-29]PKH50840.1 hypothetical protein CXF68_09140 [Tenacibaculum sp. Bg11-29]
MISKADKKRIKRIIGAHYVSDVQERLREKEIVNQRGNEHSASMITNVMNGTQHEVIEKTIYEVVEIKKQENDTRKNLLKK